MSAALFNRAGKEYTGKPHHTAKGAPFYTAPHRCGRCGGVGGSQAWAYTGYTCYDCNGRGTTGTDTIKLYTAEQLEKLNAAKAKADAKRAAAAKVKADAAAALAAANAEAFRRDAAELIALAAPHMENEFINDVITKALARNAISEKAEAAVRNAIARITAQAAARAASGYAGEVGKPITADVTVERVYSFVRPQHVARWLTETVNIVTMRDSDGNALVYKGTSFCAEKGQALRIKATVKAHEVYRDEKQTTVQRIRLLEKA